MSKTEKPAEAPLPMWLLALTVIFCGSGVIMIEVLGSRIVGPFFGVSLFIWTALITVALIGLSLGYWLGGIVADKYPSAKGLYGLIMVAVVLTLIIPLWDREVCLALSGPGHGRFNVIFASMILFLPPLTALGFISPYALRLALDRVEHAGRTAGLLYALSTVGSVVGSVLTGFFLIPLLGVSKTLIVIAVTLAIPCVIWALVMKKPKRAASTTAVVVVLCALCIMRVEARDFRNTDTVRLLAEIDGRYSLLSVVETYNENLPAWVRWLMIDGVPQTGVIAPNQEEIGATYWYENYTPLHRIQFHFYELHEHRPERVLVIGLGGGAVPRSMVELGAEVDVVDIDARVAEMAEEWMGFDPDAVTVHIMDGRSFIRQTDKTFDTVIFDVATGGSQPFHLFSKEVFEETARILTPDGVVAMNYIGFPTGKNDHLSSAVFNTVTQVFPHALTYITPESHTERTLCNMMFFFSREPFPSDAQMAEDPDTPATHRRLLRRDFLPLLDSDFDGINSEGEAWTLTDDWNPIEAYSTEISEVWREQIFSQMPRENLFRF